MSANGPLWDIAGMIHNAIHGEVVATVTEATKDVAEEIKEVATNNNPLNPTSAAPTASVVKNLADMCSLGDYYSSLFAPQTCALTDAPVASSYFGYAISGLGLVGGALGLYGISRLRTDVQKLISAPVFDMIKENQVVLEFIKALKNNQAVLALLNTQENIGKILALEALNKGTLAGIAAMSSAAQLVTIQKALEPKLEASEELQDKLIQVPVSLSSKPVMGTQSGAVSLADSILVSEAGKAVLAKIRQNEKATAVLDKMNERSLKRLELIAGKCIKRPEFNNTNDATLEALLIGIAAKVGQVIEVKKASALKM